MATSTQEQKANEPAISDKEAMEHLQRIDKRLKGKNTSMIILIIVLIISIAGNAAQFMKLI